MCDLENGGTALRRVKIETYPEARHQHTSGDHQVRQDVAGHPKGHEDGLSGVFISFPGQQERGLR